MSVTRRLVPGPLNEYATDEQVLRDILGGDPDHELLDFAAGAGGSHRLLAEFSLGLVEEGLVKEHNGTVQLAEPRIPRRVLAFVKRRLGDLSTNCQHFLKVAAVLGRSFMLEDVARMLDRLGFYLATGQDAANIVEGSQGVTVAEDRDGDLYFSCTLPNLIVGTVGNGKGLDFVEENLTRLGCREAREPGENARRLAVIAAATVLCGELSLLAAQTNPGELM
ncbi:hypothetical protein [Streptomyces sp. NPDC058092]|uniref:hypothetical protein n=1 Tax=Streptomyces sp. NPDC058092 TaxID=3346336 RepID=UPI0036E601C3